MLDTHGITCSMSRRGDCYDNAMMESFFSSVKSETADRFESRGEAKMEFAAITTIVAPESRVVGQF
jgi:putative transposase